MRKIYALFLTLVTLGGLQTTAQNVTVSGAVTGNGSYATLAAAFTAIGTSQSGANIVVDIVNNTTETGTVTIGAGNWATVLIRPSGGAARSVTGAITGGSTLIDFSGADNVTIDGLNTGGNALTIENTTASPTSGTSTIRFINDATGNLVTRCSIRGSASMTGTTNGGVIFFSTSTTIGNDNNTISFSNIGPSGSNLPSRLIYGNGSTISITRANSGIVIDNCNLFDYFAPAAAHAAIGQNDGNTDWTITNNKFYQTATRTFTTGALHAAINITGSSIASNNNVITGNTIGFANASGTGTYTITGGGNTFNAIRLNLGTTTASSIQGNTIAGISVTTTASGTTSSAIFAGIMITSGLANVGNVTGNTIGSQSATGSITVSSSSTSTGETYGVMNNGSSSFTCSNNLIGGITAGNSSTGAAVVIGIRANTISSATLTCTGNTVGGTIANSIQSTTAASSTQVIGILVSAPAATLTSNTVRNLTAAGGTGTSSSASVIGISVNAGSANHTVSQNTIHSLNNSSTTAATIVNGLYYTGSTGTNVVERNFIYGLTTATNSASAEVNGIRVAGGVTTYRNNMIALGAGISNAIGAAASNSSASGINGFNGVLGTDNFWHNSIYIGGTATAGSGASYAFNGVQTTNTRSFRNNIFFNARTNSGATGKHYAVKINGTAANPAGLTINNNVYFVNGSGGVFGYFNSLDVANIAAWRTAVGQDAGSFEGNPQYNDPTNTTPDLHLHPTNITVAEGNGVDVGVTDDFDGQTRSGLTPVDLGADAGNFTGLDLTAPSISYTNLGNTLAGTQQILTATITDGSGVPTSGAGLPVLYYRVNTGSWTAVTGVSTGGSQYTFTFTPSTVASDVVQYYVVAQDGAAPPNVIANPSAGAGSYSANPPAAGTPPTTPNSYSIQAAISGTKTVCASGCDYTSLTNTGGAFAAINGAVVTGNINLEIAGDLTAETGTNALNAFASPFTVKVYPTGSARVVSGAAASTALIRLNGADRVTIDGSVGGTGTDRSLTITNTSGTGTTTAVALVSLGTGAGATDNTIKNCVLTTATGTTVAIGISVGGSTPGTAGSDNDNVTIQNNLFSTGLATGIYAVGNAATSSTGNDNLTVTGNTINISTSATTNAIGIRLGNALNSTVSQNTIDLTTSGAGTPVGISLETGFNSSLVTRNSIQSVNATNTGGYGGRGITVGTGSASSNLTISNNFITGVNGTNWSSFGASSAMGISIGIIGSSATLTTISGGINLYYNSVNMFGSMGTASTTALTTALYVGSNASALDIRNNIFANVQTGTNTAQKNYAIYSAAANTAFTAINNNCYYVANSFNAGSAIIGFLTSDRTTLSAWQTASAQDGLSFAQNPQFVSNTNLHINTLATTYVESAATPIGGITVDYDGDTRNVTTPDVGADEGTFLAPVSNDMAATSFIDPANAGSKTVGVAFTPQASFTNVGATSQTNVQVRYRIVDAGLVEVYNQTATIASIAGGGSATVSFPAATVTPAGAYTIFAKAELGGDAVSANDEISGTLTITDPYTSSTTTQNTAAVFSNTTNQQVIGLQVVASGTGGTVSSITFNTNGTTSAADIANAKVYYTGTTNSFSATGQFGSTVAAPNGSHTVTGTQALSNGTNYFWIAYDVPVTATAGNVVDAELTSVTVNGVARTPTVTAPTGARTITDPYTSSTTTQNVNSLYVNTANQQIVGLQVVAGSANVTVSSITFNTNGTTSTADITNAKIYYTGISSSFSATGQFGTTVAAPNGSHTVTGTQALSSGTNYFWIAYDVPAGAATGNLVDAEVTSLTANGVARTPSVTAPAGARTIVGPLSGTYTVGVGGNYTTLTAAVADYNNAGIAGPVVFSLTDATYPSETFPITISSSAGASAVNTLNIRPASGVDAAITGSSSTGLIVLNAADFVTIGGSNNPQTNSVCPAVVSSRNLTLTNTNSGITSAVIWLQSSGSDGATNNVIRNCNIVGNTNTTTLFGIGSGGSSISNSSLGTGNNNNRIENNNISKVQIGIYSQGASAANKNTGTVINQNLINSALPNNVASNAIFAGFENNITISGNSIDNLQAPSSTDGIAIALGSRGVTTTTFTGNEVTNATVTNNVIGTVRGASTWSAIGIYFTTTTNTGTTTIANNMIYGVQANGTSGDLAAGIFIGGVVGTVNVFHNSVTMVGTLSGGAYPSFALASTTSSTVLNIRNNIFTSTGSTGANRNRAMGFGYSSFTNLTSNNNDLVVSGTGSAVVQTVNLTDAGATTYSTLSAWTTASTDDANSLTVVPNFVSASNLRLVTTTNNSLNNAGAPVAVSNDIDCEARSGSTPDIGVDEFCAALPAITNVTATDNITSICPSATTTLTANGVAGDGATVTWWSAAGGTGTNFGTGTTLNNAAPGTYFARVTGSCSPAAEASITINAKVNVGLSSAAANSSPICSDATTTMTANGLTGDGAVVNWWTGTGGTGTQVGSGLTSNSVAPGTYYAYATGDCGSPVEIQVVVVAKTNVSLTSAAANTNPICSNATTTLTASGLTGDGAAVTWWTGSGGSGTQVGSGLTSNPVGPGTYYAYATGDCGSPVEIQVVVNITTYTITVTAGANGSITPGTGSINCGSNASYTITADPLYNIDDVIVDGVSQGAITSYTFTNVQTTHTISASFVLAACINNNFSGTGNWTDGTKWSCGAPPNPGDNVTILAGANVTLNTDFTVAGTFSMGTGATMTVSPDQTFAVSGSANFNGQAVTFRSDATGNGRLGQVSGTLSGATNVTVERYLPNNGFRSWRLLSVPTSGTQTIRQSWQENNAPLANNVPGYGTLITGGGNNTGASQALGFDFSGPNTSMLFWNNTGWGNISGTLGAISARQAYFLYVRGDRSKTVTGLVTDAGSTTLRTRGTIYTGDQVIPALNTFSLVPNLYPSAIDFRQLTRNGVGNNFTLWDSKTQLGNQLGMYVTFSATNDFLPNIGTNSYPLTTRNARIESGQAFFVNGGAGASITLKELAKISDSANGNLGLRPVKREKLVTALETADGTLLDGNTVVFDAAFANAVNEDDAQKMGNPGANFGIETANKLLSVEGRQVAEEQDAVQFRMWNLSTGSYVLNLQAGRIAKAGVEAFLEDSYTGIQTPLELNGNTKVNFTVDASAASKAANRFRVVFGKAGTRTGTYSIAPNPVEGGVMNVVLKSQQPGRHTIKVLSAQGQVLSTRVIEHTGGNGNQQISLPAGLSRGAYLVEFISPDKTRTVQTLFVNKK